MLTLLKVKVKVKLGNYFLHHGLKCLPDKSWEDGAASLPLGERKRKERRETLPLDLFIYLRKYHKDYKKLLNTPGVLPSHLNYGPYHKFN